MQIETHGQEKVSMAAGTNGRRALIGLTMLCGAAFLSACSQETPLAAFGSPVAEAQTAAAAPAPKPAPAPISLIPASQASGFVVKSILKSERELGAGDYLWEAEGVADGPKHIVVDIAAEKIYVYSGGVEIGRAHILYGADDKPTPFGTFPILEKDADHISNIYFVPMPYMLRLTMDGIAIHGSEVEDGYATNGCIGVPDEFAELLFGKVKVGDRVLVTNGWMSPAEQV